MTTITIKEDKRNIRKKANKYGQFLYLTSDYLILDFDKCAEDVINAISEYINEDSYGDPYIDADYIDEEINEFMQDVVREHLFDAVASTIDAEIL